MGDGLAARHLGASAFLIDVDPEIIARETCKVVDMLLFDREPLARTHPPPDMLKEVIRRFESQHGWRLS